MALLLLSANHHDLDLADIDLVGAAVERAGAAAWVAAPGVRGAVVLATCNRVELYLDTEDPDGAAAAARAILAAHTEHAASETPTRLSELRGEDAVRHLFGVTAGLDSMVVGEREIAGQVRRALRAAREAGTTTPLLERALQHAARTSREVALATDLARAGRSVVSVALDLAAAHAQACRRADGAPADPHASGVPRATLAGHRALLLGTGSYAGASLAALRERGCTDVVVWSGSGRAAGFAERHGVRAVPADGLAAALAGVDLVVTCRGTGAPVLDAATVAAAARDRGDEPLVVVDLALRPDVEADVAAVPGVVVVDLATVRRHTPAATRTDVERARALVAEAVQRYALDLEGRAADRAVVALRAALDAAVADELERLPQGGTVPVEHAQRALRRLAARLAHTPTVRARRAAQEGRTSEHLLALEQVLGVPLTDLTAATPAPESQGTAR
ncbi:glutamyl-tRNA reductase [Georgenia wangjunii]|uniref:glutamyl-tRNA reductase n=1 Tax=Georgenia wangjunii TaxID=3117730 RepID=UPI002F26BBEB